MFTADFLFPLLDMGVNDAKKNVWVEKVSDSNRFRAVYLIEWRAITANAAVSSLANVMYLVFLFHCLLSFR